MAKHGSSNESQYMAWSLEIMVNYSIYTHYRKYIIKASPMKFFENNYEKAKEIAECLDEIISSLWPETWLSKGEDLVILFMVM